MKKIRKTDLRLEKEVVSALTEHELTKVKGGTEGAQTCYFTCRVFTGTDDGSYLCDRTVVECASIKPKCPTIVVSNFNSCECKPTPIG